MSATDWQRERTGFERRISEVGATPNLSLANASGSVLLAHSGFAPFEGTQGSSPYLMLSLCTGHTGRIATRNDMRRLEGSFRPGTYGLALPNLKSEGLWPGVHMLGIAVDPAHLGWIDAKAMDGALAAASQTLQRDPLVVAVMTALWRDAELHGLSSLFFDQGLDLILRHLSELDTAKPSARQVRPLSKHQLARAIDLIESRLQSDLRVEELAAALHLDVRSLTRAFRSATGLAPYAYFTRARMELAQRLLMQGLPVVDVALSTGYANPSKFAAAFRKVVGCSPSDWRRAQSL